MLEMMKLDIINSDGYGTSRVDVPGQVAEILLALHVPPYTILELSNANLELMDVAESEKE